MRASCAYRRSTTAFRCVNATLEYVWETAGTAMSLHNLQGYDIVASGTLVRDQGGQTIRQKER